MGDTYYIKNIKCVYCKNENMFEDEDAIFGNLGLPYTFEFGSAFVCENCKKSNKVKMNFVAVEPEK